MDPSNPDKTLQALLAEAPFLRRLARSLCHSEPDSDELVQETWLIALRQPPKTLDSPRGWLASTLRGRLSHWKRRQDRQVKRESMATRKDATPGGQDEVDSLDVQAHLLELVRKLPDVQRQAIWLHYYEQLDVAALANRLGCNESTIRTRISRGLASLRSQLDKQTKGGRSEWLSALAPISIPTWSAPLPATAALGAPMAMKKVVASIGILFALVLGIRPVIGLWISPGDPSEPGESTPSDGPLVDLPAPTTAQLQDGSKQEVRQSALANETGQPSSGQLPNERPRCEVYGQVVDGDNLPMAGVKVVLQSYLEWAPDAGAAILGRDPEYHGWTQRTDENGRFRFGVVMPTSKYLSLVVTPDPFHESKWIRFGGNNRGSVAPLQAGARDMGILRLLAAGTVSGVVTDEHGVPVKGANIGLGEHSGNNSHFRNKTDAHGRYRAIHVTPGEHGIGVSHPKFLNAWLHPIEVIAGQENRDVDLVLRAAPTIAGRVTDPNGQALAGVSISSWPERSGSLAQATSGEDGRFTLFLPQDCGHTLEAELRGYQPFGTGDRDTLYQPGDHQIAITLLPDVTTRFLVLDQNTGEPVLRYGMRIERNKGESAPLKDESERFDAPPPRPRAGGVLDTFARPGIDRYWLHAPGYLQERGEVAHDPEHPGRQTIRVHRGPFFVGRVVDGNNPVAGASVRLTPVYMGRGTRGGSLISKSQGSPLTRLVYHWDQTLNAKTDADGKFLLSGVSKGKTYQLDVNHGERERVRLLPIVHPGNGEHDLGSLGIQSPGNIGAHVIAPPGVPLDRIEFYVDGWKDGKIVQPSKEGQIRIEDLGPGLHLLTLKTLPGKLVGGAAWEVQVKSGETTKIQLDVTGRGLCQVSVSIEGWQAQMEGTYAFARSVHPSTGEVHGDFHSLGDFDPQGRVSKEILAMGPAHIFLGLPLAESRRITQDPIDLRIGSHHELQAEVSLESLKMQLPQGVQWPDHGILWIRIGEERARLPIKKGRIIAEESWAVVTGTQTLELHGMEPGAHSISLTITDEDRQVDESDYGSLIVWQGEQAVSIAAETVTQITW